MHAQQIRLVRDSWSRLLQDTAADAAEQLRDGAFGAGIRNTSEVALRAIRDEQ